MRTCPVLSLVLLAASAGSPVIAADWPMPAMPGAWGMPGMGSMPGLSGLPQQAGSGWSGMASQWPDWAAGGAQALQSAQGFIPWGGGAPAQSNLPWSPGLLQSGAVDLSGTWRGSGGEHVEIRRNAARIWGAGQEYCDCIFMIHGDRLIAYSPDSDVVRKYEFARDRDRFALRDEHGQTMVFQRVR
ncbi:MAG: hypothetical protein RLZ44_917 [Pseudomonadota bacterium]